MKPEKKGLEKSIDVQNLSTSVPHRAPTLSVLPPIANEKRSSASFVLLEDDILAAQELTEGLVNAGLKHLGSFISGEELLKSIGTLRPDILLVDITLAGKLDGIQTVMQLSPALPSRIIFLTGDDDEDTLRRAMVLRPHAYLLKPLSVSDVRASILTTLARDADQESALQAEVHALAKVEPESREPCALMLAFPHFAALGEEVVAKLAGRAVLREGKAGAFLMQQGQSSSTTFMMLTGVAMCCRQGIDGRELTVHVAGPGDPLGLVLALSPLQKNLAIRLPFHARYLSFPSEDIQFAINANPTFAKMLMNSSASFAADLCELATMIAYAKVEARIIKILQKLSASLGRSVGKAVDSGPGRSLRIFLTRKELAELTGTTVESAIRATKILERRGLLDLTRPGIIVIPSLERLGEAIDGEDNDE